MSFVSSDHIQDFCRGLDSERRISCQALQCWTEIKDPDKLPRLDQVNFMDNPELCDNLFTVATENGAGRFVIKNSGSILREICGDDPAGKTVMDVFPRPLDGSVFECCSTSVDAHHPMIGAGVLLLEDDREIMYRMIVLPLSDDGKDVDHMICAISFRYA